LQLDIYAGIALNGSVSDTSALEICIIPHYGLIVDGGVTGNVLYWEASTAPFNFYNRDFVFGDRVRLVTVLYMAVDSLDVCEIVLQLFTAAFCQR